MCSLGGSQPARDSLCSFNLHPEREGGNEAQHLHDQGEFIGTSKPQPLQDLSKDVVWDKSIHSCQGGQTPRGISLGAASRTFAGATTSHRKMSERAPGASHSFQMQASHRNIKAPADSFKHAALLLTKLLNDAASAPLIQEQGSSSRLLLRWNSAGRGKHKPDPTNLWISPADGCSST